MKTRSIILLILLIICLFGIYKYQTITHAEPNKMETNNSTINMETATFAGGCFWCVESDFQKVEGVINVISGFSGGPEKNPSYQEVASGKTAHLEAVQVYYNPDKVTYKELLDIFWTHIDPTDSGGQFVDRGPQYRPAIFYHSKEQQQFAEETKEALNTSGQFQKPVVTEILPFTAFYSAEEYHQDYYKKNPIRYKFYRSRSGRDQFLEATWGKETQKRAVKQKGMNTKTHNYSKPDEDVLRNKLTPMEYKVTQQSGTEPPFNNQYWNHKKEGIYVDVVSGEPLFSSQDKFESGTGWPSFTKPIDHENIMEKKDQSLSMVRTEIRSKHADSHLGHVFSDGPEPTGLRYCINSAALHFIPKEDLEKKGYGEYLHKNQKN